MHPNRAPIAILGLVVCTDEYPDLISFRRSLSSIPINKPCESGLSGTSDLLCAVLRDGNIEPNDPRCLQLGVFIAGNAPTDGLDFATQEGIQAVLTEYTGEHGALHAVVRASEALCAGKCLLAVVLALNPSTGRAHRYEGVGILLSHDSRPAVRTYAHLYPGLVRKTGNESPSDRAELLIEASTRTEVDPRNLGLLDVQGLGNDSLTLAALLNHLRTAFSRGDKHLPHCSIGPLLPSFSAVAALSDFCAVILALYERILPPLHGECREAIVRPFAADRSLRPWIDQRPLQAGVLALHPDADAAIILEQSPADPHTAPPRLDTVRPTELILLSAGGRAELMERIRDLAEHLLLHKEKPLHEVVRETNGFPPLDCRAALIVRNTQELSDKLGRLSKRMESSQTTHFQTPDGIYFAEEKPKTGKTALMIPGQGSQYLRMFGDLCLTFPQMQTWFERVHDAFGGSESCPPQLVVAPPDIGLSETDRLRQQKRLYAIGSGATVMLCGCLGLYDLLTKAGVRADAMVGYSNGENAALIASDTWRFSSKSQFFATLVELRENDVFERSGVDIPRGASAAVNNVPRECLDDILAPFTGRVFLALDNCPDQVVLFGEQAALAEITTQLVKAGAFCSELPFDRGHHTPLYQPHADMLLALYGKFDFGPGRIPLYSCITNAPFPDEPDQIRALAASQWTRCVRFGETVQRLYEDGVRYFVEVGPGSRLSGFVHNTLRGRQHAALSVNIPGRPGLEQFLKSLGHLFVLGQDIDMSPLWITEQIPSICPPLSPAAEELNSTALPPYRLPPEGSGDNISLSRRSIMSRENERMPPDTSATPPADPQPSGAEGTQRILAEHFLLMQDFLESQRRSLKQLGTILGGQGSAVPPPRQLHTQWPMLGEQIETGEGWLKARRTFTPARDPFLRHHAFGMRRSDAIEDIRGLPVIPFTFSMELVAEASRRLSGWTTPGLTLSGLNAVRWLAVDDALTVDIEANFAEFSDTKEKAVRVRIFEILDANEGLRALAFEGWAHPDTKPIGTPLKSIPNTSEPRISATQLNARLFHGPLFKSIRDIKAIDEGGAELKAVVPPVAGLFQDQDYPELRIPAALLDAVGQLVFYWLCEQGYQSVGLFPFQAARYVQFVPPPAPGSAVFLRGQARLTAKITHADVDILDEQGALLARIEGLKMKLYDFDDCYLHYVLGTEPDIRLSKRVGNEWRRRLESPPGWFSAEVQDIWTRLLARVAMNERERLASREISASERLKWILVRVVAKELILDWLKFIGIYAGPADIEVIATDAGFFFQGEALRRLPDKLCVQIEAVEPDIVAVMTWTHDKPSRQAEKNRTVFSDECSL